MKKPAEITTLPSIPITVQKIYGQAVKSFLNQNALRPRTRIVLKDKETGQETPLIVLQDEGPNAATPFRFRIEGSQRDVLADDIAHAYIIYNEEDARVSNLKKDAISLDKIPIPFTDEELRNMNASVIPLPNSTAARALKASAAAPATPAAPDAPKRRGRPPGTGKKQLAAAAAAAAAANGSPSDTPLFAEAPAAPAPVPATVVAVAAPVIAPVGDTPEIPSTAPVALPAKPVVKTLPATPIPQPRSSSIKSHLAIVEGLTDAQKAKVLDKFVDFLKKSSAIADPFLKKQTTEVPHFHPCVMSNSCFLEPEFQGDVAIQKGVFHEIVGWKNDKVHFNIVEESFSLLNPQ